MLPCDMCVAFRESPEAGSADCLITNLLPVPALLARPRLGPLTRSVQEHVCVWLIFVVYRLPSDLIRDAVVYLEVTGFGSLACYGVARAISLNKSLPESLRERLPPTYASANDFVWVIETIGTNPTP